LHSAARRIAIMRLLRRVTYPALQALDNESGTTLVNYVSIVNGLLSI
jgi:hypothetical protein